MRPICMAGGRVRGSGMDSKDGNGKDFQSTTVGHCPMKLTQIN